jgi:hypothetical protein
LEASASADVGRRDPEALGFDHGVVVASLAWFEEEVEAADVDLEHHGVAYVEPRGLG